VRTMDYSTFKALQFIGFFAVAFGIGFWQLWSLRRHKTDD